MLGGKLALDACWVQLANKNCKDNCPRRSPLTRHTVQRELWLGQTAALQGGLDLRAQPASQPGTTMKRHCNGSLAKQASHARKRSQVP